MPAADRELDLHALRNLIDEARAVIEMADLPPDRTKRVSQLLNAALALTDDILASPVSAESLGKRGGLKTAERGSAYYSDIAKRRRIKSGGPRKR